MMTELEIDQSHLPRVQKVCQCFAVLEDGVLAHSLQEQEIEQHYSSNVQKSQRVQTDLRVAKRLQDEEEREAPLSQATRRLEEQDFEYALMIQDEIQRCAEEARRREREDEEVAKRIQEEEEMGAKHRKLESGCHGNSTAFPLCEGAELWQRGVGLWQRGAGLELGSLQQVLLDQELAWSLQEEEENIHRKLRRGSRSPPRPPSADPEDDFRAAQVAQDEEIARFMQRQEMKTKWRSCDLEGQGSQGERDDSGDVRQSRECPERKLQVQREEPPSANEERIDPKPANTAHQRQPIRNIAEELDPTFKARRKGMSQARPTSSDLCLTPPTPHRGFHDYSDEPLFIPPTKRRSDRSGRGKAKEKKEGCKQQ
ncbi:coiled-coil domain-containing protein 50-like isoform X2 [Anguilla rostrata]|uniref:coiled-coil domain-containing protein 50-like isoform X2 n=1 Tax=Anguilla rostrata TaxID=7938 RepID=UPI0030D1E019